MEPSAAAKLPLRRKSTASRLDRPKVAVSGGASVLGDEKRQKPRFSFLAPSGQGARLVAVATVAAYFVLLTALEGPGKWARLGVPRLSPGFAYVRVITYGWGMRPSRL